ncbi:MAG TPA: sensor histidine kinase [Cellulomonas sp.]|nr:sensor histidine kinase [Cellulomonas sp.]
MRPHPSAPVTRGLLIALDVLVVALLVTAAVQPSPSVEPWVTITVGVAFGLVYARGRTAIRLDDVPGVTGRGAWWPAGAWMLGLMLIWVALLATSTAGLWIAFPLMLLQMHVLGPHRGTLAVAGTTMLAVGAGLLQKSAADPAIGFVLGPVLGGGVAVGVVLGLEALARESDGRRRTVEELTAVREHLAAAERDAAVAGERERLAREIHDTLAQGYSAIELLLRAADASIGADDELARRYVDQARTTAQENLGEARRFVHALAPADLDGATLVAALQRVAARTQETADGGLRVRVETSGTRRRLPVAVEAALVRVAQSALANVVQHADARTAAVTLTYLDDEVFLDVVDDGRGFAGRPDPTRGFGLVAMGSRIQELGGTLTVESAPGDGTAIAVRLPTEEAS